VNIAARFIKRTFFLAHKPVDLAKGWRVYFLKEGENIWSAFSITGLIHNSMSFNPHLT
jgi:hypothetical protein